MNTLSTEAPIIVFTIGHSTRSCETFIQLLKTHAIERVVDIRTIPRSRHNPQFNQDTLPAILEASGISYSHMKELGGLRRTLADSPNMGWHNASFRGFADYMQTEEFVKSLEKFIECSKTERVALMCAEAVPWRCHRSLIADALTVRHIRVEHIMDLRSTKTHTITPWAHIAGATITYPSP
ncbi:MAG: DUF488 domain-containing protein [Syntrophales bacterium]|nr:DUF488 domain-containing protein [Syntrophales bacterium]